MARRLQPKDCYALMNRLVKEAIGANSSITAVDTSSFVSAGESVLATGTENVLNSLAMVVGRRMVAVRPYNAPLRIINAINTGLYSDRLLKDSFYSRWAQPSGAFNTDLFTNLAQGFTAGENIGGSPAAPQSTKSQWEQNLPVPMEFNFAGRNTWQDCSTIPEIQLQQAFRDEASFSDFVTGYMMERANDLESQKEAYNRMTLLNYMAGLYDMSADMPGSVVNLTAAFNTEFGTSYTASDLMGSHLKEFMEFFTARVKIDSDRMKDRTVNYHWSPAKQIDGVDYYLLRHTPKEKQKLILYAPLFAKAQSYVFPEIFNPQYLRIENYEGVSYWQNAAEGEQMKISVTPAIPDTSNPAAQKAGSAVTLDNVVGVLFDEDALMVDYQLETALSTPVEARKHYRNVWYTYAKNSICDFTEKGILYYLG
jgi:hypothetical protein